MTMPPSPGGPGAWPPRAAWGPVGVPPAPNPREADLAALSHVWTAALIAIIGSALGVAVPLALSTTGYFSLTVPAAGETFSYGETALLTVLGISLVGFVLSIVSLWFYREGFLAVRSVDTRFSSSPTWALLAIVGLVLVFLALIVILYALLQVLSCVSSSATPGMFSASCVNIGALLGGFGLLLVGGIILLIGYIGTLVAIFRLGTRYNDSMFKIGAVLLIFPYLSVVGQILVLVAASRARSRVQQGPVYGFSPSVGTWSPPPPR